MSSRLAAQWIVHTAGEPIGMIQSCTACGHVLEDNTAWLEGRVAIAGDDPHGGPLWFPTGGRVAQFGACSVTLPDRELEADERFCAGAN